MLLTEALYITENIIGKRTGAYCLGNKGMKVCIDVYANQKDMAQIKQEIEDYLQQQVTIEPVGKTVEHWHIIF